MNDVKYTVFFVLGLIIIAFSEQVSSEAISLVVGGILTSIGGLGMIMEDYINKTKDRY
ncbi:hypothetical protein IMX26_06870 [Clostridium sp. 'deep sea']|uniref:hypothetical protein n=1 Tax=Clostridium sp. 'deep sea' TaxID=2779445 RepID=UPI001896766A|nr:hypothetical protein [Clostridium sp. 'deep sea']QOR36525.1 hypothetical protein IMX26_06870 [Clostridium sp. 'deep sea']